MNHETEFFIDGKWTTPSCPKTTIAVHNPATEDVIGEISAGTAADVDRAVDAAQKAFEVFSQWSTDARDDLLASVLQVFERRRDELADVICDEVGAPLDLARGAQTASGAAQLSATRRALQVYEFETEEGPNLVRREGIGVCALITPWNWPINQIVCKVAPALAAGCTMVLKPSEVAPRNAIVFAEILAEAGVPDGVFNVVHGDGATVGSALSAHPGVDMVSFTGSTRAGIEVARSAAPTVKRVAQELGGKSANILLESADLEIAIRRDMNILLNNSGQSCNAPTRFLVPRRRAEEAVAMAADAARDVVIGNPRDPLTTMGPVVSAVQYARVQELIAAGLAEGATVVEGGLGRPEGLERGFFVKPTVFGDVTNEMRIARDEIFGPVVVIISYADEDEAVDIANDTPYGLSCYISGEPDHAIETAKRIRAGNVHINGASGSMDAPFGGYKQSGNGRERGRYGLEEFLEAKTILGYRLAAHA